MERGTVITGLGIVTPNGIGKKKFWDSISKGKSYFRVPSVIKNRGYKEILGSEIKDFNLDYYFLKDVKRGKFVKKDYNRIKSGDKSIQFAVLGTKLALEDAVLEFDGENNDVGAFIGNAEEPIQSNELVIELIIQSIMRKTFDSFDKKAASSNFFWALKDFVKFKNFLKEENLKEFIDLLHERYGTLYSFTNFDTLSFKSYAIPAKISSLFNLHGPSMCINTACSAGLDAIGYAHNFIKQGFSDCIIAGGTESPITLQTLSALDNLGVVSQKGPKPYCADRDGFAISEGAGIVVLEEKEHALKRKAKIYAEIKGYAQSIDGEGQMLKLNSEGKFLKKAIEKAIDMSGLNRNEIDYINTHGTATKTCDVIETKVIREVFGEHAYKLNISATKSMTGHSIGAVGGIEAIITVLAMQDNLVPPTINLDNPDPECDLNYTPNKAVERPIRNSLILSMGFGGYNSALILGKYEGR